MKTINIFLWSFFSIFLIFESMQAAYYYPAPECVKVSEGYYDGRMMTKVSNLIRCRMGQKMKVFTAAGSDMKTDYCCCKWDETLSAVQTTHSEFKFYANRCKFKNDSAVPARESLLVTGNDLYCFKGEELQSFKAEIDGKVQGMACCKEIPKTTTVGTTKTTTTEQLTTISTEQLKIDETEQLTTKIEQLTTKTEQPTTPRTNLLKSSKLDQSFSDVEQLQIPRTITIPTPQTSQKGTELVPNYSHPWSTTFATTVFEEDDDEDVVTGTSTTTRIKLRGQVQASVLPEITVASECVYASSTSTDPVKAYMSYDEGVTLGCRSQQKMISTTIVNQDDGNTYNVFCCKFDPKLPVVDPLPPILGHVCEFNENGELQSFSGVKPGPDLVCDSNHELITVTTKDLVKQTPVTLSCCKTKEETTTTTTTATTTLKSTTKTTNLPNSPQISPNSPQNSTISQVGAECIYLRDGTLKVNYMDYCDDHQICRSQQFIKTYVQKKQYDRCCCQYDKTLPIENKGLKLRAFDCAYKKDGTISRWSLVASGPDLVCNPGFKMKETIVYENGEDTSLSCCIKDVPETTTVARTTTTTTMAPSGTTTKAPPPVPVAGIQCSYNEDQTIRTGFMDKCVPGFTCRSKEVKLEMSVSTSDNTQVKKCCCDYRKELPENNTAVASIIAPKCFYDLDGYVKIWSVVETGNDLGCMMTDNLMVYDLGYESTKMSCCLKKDAVTISTTMRTSPLTTTSTTSLTTISTTSLATTTITLIATTTTTSKPTPKGPYKLSALECVYLKNGSLNIDFMSWNSSTVGCRSQYIVRKVMVQSYPKICCEFSSSLPFDPSLPPLIAPTCYFSSRTAEIARWSIEVSGPDLVCKDGFYMYNTTILQNGTLTGFSCCQPVDKPIPTPKPVPTTTTGAPGKELAGLVTTTTENPKTQASQIGPVCRYAADKTLITEYMEQCGVNQVCLSQQLMINQTAATASGSSVNLCCCDSRPDIPPMQPNSSINALKCHFDIYGNINVYSLKPFDVNLKCENFDEMRNFTMEINSMNQTMSCCMQKGETTITTTPRQGSTDSMATTTSPIITQGPAAPITNATTIPDTKTTVAPTTPFKGKRTVPPRKSFPPQRVVGPGECPDCLYPESGPIDSLYMIIQHLKQPGPEMGSCPIKTHTLRIIQPMSILNYKEGRCCCENDQFPLPYSFS